MYFASQDIKNLYENKRKSLRLGHITRTCRKSSQRSKCLPIFWKKRQKIVTLSLWLSKKCFTLHIFHFSKQQSQQDTENTSIGRLAQELPPNVTFYPERGICVSFLNSDSHTNSSSHTLWFQRAANSNTETPSRRNTWRNVWCNHQLEIPEKEKRSQNDTFTPKPWCFSASPKPWFLHCISKNHGFFQLCTLCIALGSSVQKRLGISGPGNQRATPPHCVNSPLYCWLTKFQLGSFQSKSQEFAWRTERKG